MAEFHGLPGERIVECNLSYRLGDLPWWLCTHHITSQQLGTDTVLF